MGGMYEDLKGPEIPSVLSESSIILLPVGAIELHGPHLPMSVDRVIAEETAKAIVAKCGDDLDIWLLPTLSVSKSNEHNWSEGTISLRYETLMAVLHDIGESLSKTNAKKLMILNSGSSLSILNKWVANETDIWARVELVTNRFIDHPNRTTKGWIKM